MPTDDRSSRNDYVVVAAPQFGQALIAYRRRRGVSQAALAAELGVNRSYLSGLEQGRTSEQVDRLVKAFHLLGVEILLHEASDDGP